MKEKIICIRKIEISAEVKLNTNFTSVLCFEAQPRSAERSSSFESNEQENLNVKNLLLKQQLNKNSKKYTRIKKCMQNMLYLAKHCNLDAVYPFLNLFKALEIFTSKRLVKFVEI